MDRAGTSDLHGILKDAAEQSAEYAVTLGEELLAAADRIAVHPLGGWKVAEYNRESVREMFVNPFRLVYQVEGDACRIVAVIHAARDLRKAAKGRTRRKK